ncbi:hypothetical protein AGMMS49941_06680 [Deferribacterales bacterium]|nr:hypothetical protein AGMMS49941_06680 [Deferribacterales bacterium]
MSVSLFDEGKLFIIRHAEKLKGTDKFLANTSRSNTSSIIIISTDVAASKQLQTAASDAGFTLEAESARREEDSNFSFVNAFLAKDRKKCAEIAAKLGEHKDGERAFYLLTSYIAGLYFKLALPKLYTANNPFFKGKSYFMQSVNNYANRWKAEETVGIINTMLEIDTDLKTGKIAPEYMLTNLLGYCASSM